MLKSKKVMNGSIERIFEDLIEFRLRLTADKYSHLHSCVIVQHLQKDFDRKLSVGINSPRLAYPGSCYLEHSEVSAIKKLSKQKNNKKIPVDFFINRTNRGREIKSSRPCEKCVKHMSRLDKKGYKVCDVYFPDLDGTIIKVKFQDLLIAEDKFVSLRFSNKLKQINKQIN
jgi:hypothetical protein